MLKLRSRRGVVVVPLLVALLLTWMAILSAGCGDSSVAQEPSEGEDGASLTVIAVESFLADIAGNVAGDRMDVESLMPVGADPHGFELTPADAARVAGCDVLIMNGADLEPFLEETVETIGEQARVIVASTGLESRTPKEGEETHESDSEASETGEHHHHEGDPHFWLDPTLVMKYVENIRDGLGEADLANASIYEANAAAYIESLDELDTWIEQQVSEIPSAARLLVTNHESLGYFADRYGFQIVGTIIPSVSSNASPSAQQLAELVALIREKGVRAIFLETGSSPQLAEQVASETGIEVVTELYSHSLTDTDGPAPTYIDMMKANTTAIVEALR